MNDRSMVGTDGIPFDAICIFIFEDPISHLVASDGIYDEVEIKLKNAEDVVIPRGNKWYANAVAMANRTDHIMVLLAKLTNQGELQLLKRFYEADVQDDAVDAKHYYSTSWLGTVIGDEDE